MKVFDLVLIALFGLCVSVWWVFLAGVDAQTKPEPQAPPTDYNAVSIQETINTENVQAAMKTNQVQPAQ